MKTKDGTEVGLLNSDGPQKLSNEWGQNFTIASNGENGSSASVHAKIDANGNLGFLEVKQSGTFFDDADGPILVTLLPPNPSTNGISGVNNAALNQPAEQQINDLVAGQPVDDGTGTSELLNENEPANLGGGLNPRLKRAKFLFPRFTLAGTGRYYCGNKPNR